MIIVTIILTSLPWILGITPFAVVINGQCSIKSRWLIYTNKLFSENSKKVRGTPENLWGHTSVPQNTVWETLVKNRGG